MQGPAGKGQEAKDAVRGEKESVDFRYYLSRDGRIRFWNMYFIRGVRILSVSLITGCGGNGVYHINTWNCKLFVFEMSTN